MHETPYKLGVISKIAGMLMRSVSVQTVHEVDETAACNDSLNHPRIKDQ